MNEKKKKHTFGLQKKIVLFVTILALITYTTSALFIQFVQPLIFDDATRSLGSLRLLPTHLEFSGLDS